MNAATPSNSEVDVEVVENEDSSIATLAIFYYFYMLLCIVIGLTGNSMVWILIR